MKEKIKEEFHSKLFCYDVGEDRFGYAFHPELQIIVDNLIQKHGLFNQQKHE